MRKCRRLLCMFLLLIMYQTNKADKEEYSGDSEAIRTRKIKETHSMYMSQHHHSKSNASRREEVEHYKQKKDIKYRTMSDDNGSRIRLIEQAAAELKNVLNKRTVSKQVKSQVLSRIFDSQGDPKKASLANEIFRKALEPAQPTHGAVGDLGAEMIKVSVLTKPSQKLLAKFMHATSKQHSDKRHSSQRPDQHTPSVHVNSKTHFQPKPTQHNTQNPAQKRFHNTAKLNARQYRLKLHLIHNKLEKMLTMKRKLYRYKLTPKAKQTVNRTAYVSREKNDTLNFDGKTAKFLSIRVHARGSRSHKTNTSSVKNETGLRERKDYVIELDDSNNMEFDDPGERRHLDSVISLLRHLSLPGSRDVEYIDDNGDDEDVDDGYLSPQRRRIGQNLFLNSFAQDDEEEEDMPETEEQAYQRSLEHFDPNEEELSEPHLEEPFDEENTENFPDEENFFRNRPSINPYGSEPFDGRPVVMEYEKKKRDNIQVE